MRCVRCVTRAPVVGKAGRFYGNPFAFLAHMAVRHSPERGWISNHNKSEASPPRWSGGNRADPEASPRPSALTERCWTARLPTARLPFCEGEKKKTVAVQQNAGFVLSIGGNCKKTGPVFTQAFPDMHPQHQGAHVCESENHQRVVRLRSASCFFHVTYNARHQHGQTAATALQSKRNMDHTRTAPLSTQGELHSG